MQQAMNTRLKPLSCRPVRCQAAAKDRHPTANGVLALGAAVFLAAAPIAQPEAAHAASYQERMEALQKRKDLLAEARQQAEGGPSVSNEPPPAPKEEATPKTGNSYMDKIQSSFSLQMGPGAPNAPTDPEPEAPRSLFSGDKKGPMAFPSSPLEDKKDAAEESKPAFSFFNFGGGDSKPTESKPSSPFPAVDEPKGDSKPAFSFLTPKAEEAPAKDKELPKPLPFAAQPQATPAPEAAAKPWWERTDEIGGSVAPAKKAEPKVDKKAEKKREEEERKRAEEEAAQKAAADKKAAEAKAAAAKGGRRKTNGFALFASQMLMLGGIVGGAYALLFKGEQLEGLMKAADKAILDATAKKEGSPSA